MTTSSHFSLSSPTNKPSKRSPIHRPTARAHPHVRATMAGKRATSSTLVLLFFHLVTLASSDPESETLIKFKDSLTNTGALSKWAGPGPPCSGWPGVICEGGVVWGLKLENMGLGGTVDVDSLGRLTGLRTVSLMNNELDGPLPSLSQLGALKSIYLSNNKFSGEIAADTFDGMMSLKKLHLANNRFVGPIPVGLARLPKLVELRLENNGFEGEIPEFQQVRMRDFNVSNNQLIGEIPLGVGHLNASSFSGNLDLCGAPLDPCTIKRHIPLVTIITVSVIVTVAVAALLAVVVILHRRKKPAAQPDPNETATSAAANKDGPGPGDLDQVERGQGSMSPETGPGKPGVRLTFLREGGDRFDMSDLLKASAEVLGSGSCGSTYKAALDSGKVMVVKRFRQMNTVSREEFVEHMRRLGRLDHDNVLPVIAFYYRKEEKLLVAEYVPNVSLAEQLHGNKSKGQPTLDWPTRLNIIKGVARGLQYLYHELPSLMAPHGHLKSSNVLLDSSFKPLLTDYGLLPIINPDHARANMVSHKSPESSKSGGRITRKSDIWSLGVLILETVTGKSTWDSGELDDLALEELDQDVEGPANRGEMMRLLRVGLSCCQADPNARPEIKEVIEKIDEVGEKEGDDDFYSSYASEADMRSSRGLSDDFKTINI
ncbi:leucine-rich repeat protein kinase family protein [Striga asiatica]|uniref:Leucine-rich repeat protein kinase family protein n=1 Tax=Striga asiatica TaxID=4170 RepID=A0A5A7PUC3_STRAF|nr:leucine-rich repeat protein kinase family protein [Striga asiatica]